MDHLLRYERAESYPYRATGTVVHAHSGELVKLSLLRKAIEVWFECQANPSLVSVRHRIRADEFNGLFTGYWDLLPSEEVVRVARALVSDIAQGEDTPIDAQFDPEKRVTFTSGRQHSLFTLLHILRRVDPELADSLMPQYPELAAAAALFPFGQESVREAWLARQPVIEPGGTARRGYMVSWGSEKDLAFAMALMDGQQLGEFRDAFDHAREFLDQDLRINKALKECWPSTQVFRSHW